MRDKAISCLAFSDSLRASIVCSFSSHKAHSDCFEAAQPYNEPNSHLDGRLNSISTYLSRESVQIRITIVKHYSKQNPSSPEITLPQLGHLQYSIPSKKHGSFQVSIVQRSLLIQFILLTLYSPRLPPSTLTPDKMGRHLRGAQMLHLAI